MWLLKQKLTILFLLEMRSLTKSLGLWLLLAATAATAQTTYRWIDPASGRTVISDRPPPPGVKPVATTHGEAAADAPPLSYATRQAREKFPVTLFTAENCAAPCKQARELLNGRGVPFSEKALKSDEDIAALRRLLGGEPSVPTLAVGRQLTPGIEAGAWHRQLDLAGYPKTAPFGSKPSGTAK